MKKPHLQYKDQTPRERTWTIHLISLEKVLKAIIAVVIGFKLLSLLGRDVHQWALDLVDRHGINSANAYVQRMLERTVGVGDTQITQFSIVAFGFAALLFVESIGLWMQRRWAEYLTVVGTALFIPVEIYEIYERLTLVRVGALGVNLFIVWYLATRLRQEKVYGDLAIEQEAA